MAVLDQRLLRTNPELIATQLGRRGMQLDIQGLQRLASQERDLEQQRSELQAEGNRIGKEVGQCIRAGAAADSPAVLQLRASEAEGQLLASAYWAAIAAGRLAAVPISRALRPGPYLALGVAGSTAAAGMSRCIAATQRACWNSHNAWA
jgi:hypothetical protein